MRRLTFLFLIIFLPLMANADVININDIYYDLDFSTKTAEVKSNPNKYTDSVDIPSSITFKGSEYSVISIGEYAFASCSSLTSATIPNSVTEIGSGAFRECSSLTSITIPNNVTSIGSFAFYNCSNLTSVTIGNSVTSIGDYAFYECSGLTSVHITDLAAWCKLEFYAYSNPLLYAHHLFMDGKEITNLIIPSSVTLIGSRAFNGCSNLTSVTIPNNVTAIGAAAFEGCSGLTSVTIPNSVTSIWESAFYNCSSLTSVHITDLEAWCNINFENEFSNPLYFANHLFMDGKEITDLIIPNNVSSIGNYAFSGCSDLTSVTIHNKVTTIGTAAFQRCSNLTSVHITDMEAWCRINFLDRISNPLYFANHLFMDGKEITDLIIPNSITSIGNYTFSSCSGLTSVTIPNNIISIGDYAFNNCRGLISVTIPNSVISIGERAFFSCTGLKDVYCCAENVPTTGNQAFYNGKIGLRNATLHVPEQSINVYKTTSPWSGFGTIKVITYLIDGIYYIIDSNNKQAKVTTDDVKYAGSIVIPSSITFNDTEYDVTCIGDSAFYGCSGLTSVSVPNTITSIGNAAIANCIELAEVYCHAEQVPTTGSDVFKDSYINYVTLYVPESSINTYKSTAPWSGFGSIVALPEPSLRGDVNGDGVVNGTDIQAIINLIVAGEYDEKGDVNEDNVVNGTDIQEVINIIVNEE